MQTAHLNYFITQAFSLLPSIIVHLDKDEKPSCWAKFKALQKRFYDPEFRLAIVGNFSCGKSTFLNALLGENLLTVDVLPTTAIPTYIRWNKNALLKKIGRDKNKYNNPIIILKMTDGKAYPLTKSGKLAFERETGILLPNNVGAVIDTLTTTNSLIGKIKRVDLTFKERKGFENFCLIDTPGINPGDEASKYHILQTQNVLREYADAVILLYSAKDAMTRDTEEFMRDNASHLMAGAIIILTKMDLVPKRQVEKIISNTARLVKDRFKQTEPKIYSISAQRATDYFSGESKNPEDLQWANNFNNTLNEIIHQLSDRRSEIVSKRISNLMRELIDSISKTVTSELIKLEEKRTLLKKASAENLEREFNELNQTYENHLLEKINSNLQAMQDIVQKIIRDSREKLFQKIDAAKTSDELNNCLNISYPAIMKEASDKTLEQTKEQIISPINKSSQDYAKQVEECLNRYERYLGAVSTQAATIKNEQNFAITTVAPKVKESFFDNHLGKIGVAAFALFGVIGLAVVAGNYFWNKSSRFNEKKNRAKKDVSQKLNDYETKLLVACKESINQTKEETLTWARDLLEKYKAEYKTTFESIEKNYNERVAEIEARIIRDKKNIGRIQDLKNFSSEI